MDDRDKHGTKGAKWFSLQISEGYSSIVFEVIEPHFAVTIIRRLFIVSLFLCGCRPSAQSLDPFFIFIFAFLQFSILVRILFSVCKSSNSAFMLTIISNIAYESTVQYVNHKF